jgi:hypothetical protein
MVPIPSHKRVLFTGPWTAGLAAGIPAFICLPAYGRNAALALWLAMAVPMVAAAVYVLYRSDYGARHGIVASVFLWTLFTTLAASICVAAAHLGGEPAIVPWLVAGVLLALAAVQGLATRHHLERLMALGESGAWVRASLDLRRAIIRGGHETADDIQRLAASRWLLAIAIFNAPWVIKALSLNLSLLMLLLAAAMVLVAALFCVRFLGPLAARSMFVLHLEQQRGVHFVHEEIEALNRLRRSYWLSRLLMRREDRAAPLEPTPSNDKHTPSQRQARRR